MMMLLSEERPSREKVSLFFLVEVMTKDPVERKITKQERLNLS